MASVLSRSSLRLLLLPKQSLELGIASQSTAAGAANQKYLSELDSIKQAGTWKTERVITSNQDVSVKVAGTKGPILNFCANNYLGLSSHPQVVEAAIEALRSHGAGVSSVRFICGTQDIHKELEQKISKFHGREDSILSDELNHASIIDGIRLCKSKKFRYR